MPKNTEKIENVRNASIVAHAMKKYNNKTLNGIHYMIGYHTIILTCGNIKLEETFSPETFEYKFEYIIKTIRDRACTQYNVKHKKDVV